jgi:hypothetical protein
MAVIASAAKQSSPCVIDRPMFERRPLDCFVASHSENASIFATSQ